MLGYATSNSAYWVSTDKSMNCNECGYLIGLDLGLSSFHWHRECAFFSALREAWDNALEDEVWKDL